MAQIQELLQLLVKAQRAQQLYLPNNPVYQQAIDRVRDSFRRAWEAADELAFQVSESELTWEGQVVYSESNRAESIAWLLYKDGVRAVTFLPGVEDEELVKLLDALRRARTLQPDDNDDLLTLLWERDFERLKYVAQDLTSDLAMPSLPAAEEAEKREVDPAALRRAVEEEAPQRPEGLVRADDFDTTLYFLDDREIEYLRAAIQEEYTQDLRHNVLAMVFDVLELQTYQAVRTELISILESLMPYLLGAADFGAVAYVLRESKSVQARARELKPEHRAALERFPARLSEEEALSQLLQSLDEAAVHPAAEELTELFSELRAEALPTLFNWLPRLTNARVRDVVEASAQRLAAANVPSVVAALRSPDSAVVAAATRLAGRLKLQGTVQALGEVLGHDEALVRVAVVQALAEIATPAGVQALERGLDDPDREVRLASVKVIAQHKSRSALPKITAVVQGKSVRTADLTEKMAFFEAYGMLVGEAGVDTLDGILNSGGFLKRKEDPQTRACAAMALGRIGTPSALESLKKATADKEPLVRNAVLRAMRGDRSSALFKAGELGA